MGFQWAVRVGQSLPTRFGLNGAARELVLVQIVVNCVGIRGVPQTLTQWSLYMSGSAETFFGGYEQKYTSEWRAINYIFLSICREHDTHEITAGSWDVYFLFWTHHIDFVSILLIWKWYFLKLLVMYCGLSPPLVHEKTYKTPTPSPLSHPSPRIPLWMPTGVVWLTHRYFLL